MNRENGLNLTRLINTERLCDCGKTHINCLSAREWLASQLGVWRFTYEKRDVRDKKLHPATFPISLAQKVISLFTHKGELVIDPFVGSGTTLLAAQDLDRNAVGFDLNDNYVNICEQRINSLSFDDKYVQYAINDDAMHISDYFKSNSVSLILTSPPYANLLNRPRKNKSRLHRNNEQLNKIEQYSQDSRDLGTMDIDQFSIALGEIFHRMYDILKPKGHCVINVPDYWMDDKRVTLHIEVVNAMRKAGYELRNTIIWDRTNIVNAIGIFGYPSNYITMGTTYEYLLHFRKPL